MQRLPSGGQKHKAAAYLQNRDRDSKKRQNHTAGKKRHQQNNEAVDRHPFCNLRPDFIACAWRKRQKGHGSPERINDREKSRKHKQKRLDDVFHFSAAHLNRLTGEDL